MKIIKESENVITPKRSNPTDSGMDIYSYKFLRKYDVGGFKQDLSKESLEAIDLKPLERVLISTGLKATVAPGYEIQVRPRSGLALKNGLTVLNTPGTIDYDYDEDIGVILVNNSSTKQVVSLKERIAQLVVQKVELVDVEIVTDLGNGKRSGFGSTGVE